MSRAFIHGKNSSEMRVVHYTSLQAMVVGSISPGINSPTEITRNRRMDAPHFVLIVYPPENSFSRDGTIIRFKVGDPPVAVGFSSDTITFWAEQRAEAPEYSALYCMGEKGFSIGSVFILNHN